MIDTQTKLTELAQELQELLDDLRSFKLLYPYEQQYVLRRSYEILRENQQIIGQVLTIKK